MLKQSRSALGILFMSTKIHFDTSRELLVERYRQGIRLVRPHPHAQRVYLHSISSIYHLPLTAYFVDRESRLLNVNSASVEILGAQSEREVFQKTAGHFTSKELGLQVLENNNAVINSASMKTIEETGTRSDNFLVQAFSFKFPWYFEDKIIGLFGCSIKLDANSWGGFSYTLFQLMQTGLLTPGNVLPRPLEISACSDVYLSRREKEVLYHLAYGRKIQTIADALKLSKRTIETYMERIKKKLNLPHREDLIAFYWDELN